MSLDYFLSDHLGSATVTTDVNGYAMDELKYKPWGEVRSGTAPTNYTDPSGHCPLCLAALVIVATVAYDVISTPAIIEPRSAPPSGRDATTWLVDRLNANSQAPVTQALRENLNSSNAGRIAGALKGWVGMVRTGGVWDYKGDILLSRAAQNGRIELGTETVNYQAVANVNYGFMASRIGLPKWAAEAGAGTFQILSHERGSALTWGDDPFDNYMINFGYELAETNGSNTGALTTKTFTESFSSFMTQRGRPPKPLEEGW